MHSYKFYRVLSLSSFIAQRLFSSKHKSFTKTIIRFAIASVAISVAVMIIATCVIGGFKDQINNKVFGFWGHIHITDTNISRNFEILPISKSGKYYKQLQGLGQVEYQVPDTHFGKEVEGVYVDKTTFGGVSHVQPYIILPGLMQSGEGFQATLFKGVDEDFDWDRMERFMVSGTKLSTDSRSGSEVVISQIIANKLKLKVGDQFIFSFVRERKQLRRKLKVVGVYNTGLEEFDRRFVIGDIRKARQILQWDEDQVGGIEVFIDDIRDMKIITEYIYSNVLPLDLYSESIKEKFNNIFSWLELQNVNELVIYQLMTIVAIINMITVILILILERSRMIGVLKSLGANNGMIKRIFLINAGYIIALGLLIGNVLGIGLVTLQYYTGLVKLDESSYYLDRVPIKFEWFNIVIINLGAFGVIMLSLLIPVILITRISPVKVLRFD